MIAFGFGYIIGFISGWLLCFARRRNRLQQPAVTLTFATLKGTLIMDFVVKDDQPDVTYNVTLGEVTDAEGNVIDNPQGLKVDVTSSDENVVALTPGPDGRSGTAHFGKPGQAAVTANVRDAKDNILATGTANFTVTTGDPAAVNSVIIGFEGLAPTP